MNVTLITWILLFCSSAADDEKAKISLCLDTLEGKKA